MTLSLRFLFSFNTSVTSITQINCCVIALDKLLRQLYLKRLNSRVYKLKHFR